MQDQKRRDDKVFYIQGFCRKRWSGNFIALSIEKKPLELFFSLAVGLLTI